MREASDVSSPPLEETFLLKWLATGAESHFATPSGEDLPMKRFAIGLGIVLTPGLAFAGTDTQTNGVNATDTITMQADVTNSITLTVAGDGTDTVLLSADSLMDFGSVDAYGNQDAGGNTVGSNTANSGYGGAFAIGSLQVTVEFQGYGEAEVTLERGAIGGTGTGTPDIVFALGEPGDTDWSTATGTAVPQTPAPPESLGASLADSATVDVQVGFGLPTTITSGTYTTDLLFTAIGT